MQIDIKTTTIEPLRNTFDNIVQRTGKDKSLSRYLEATLDVQPEVNFHYRPLWQPEFELYDKRRTAIVMDDWYKLLDPRQYYYGTYTIARAKHQETMENNFSFVEKRDLLDVLEDQWRERIQRMFLPLRHVEWGANMNNCYIAAYAWGTAITQSATYHTMDRLGIAQYISRIGLLLDGNQGDSLDHAKDTWMNDAVWQPLRQYVEDTFVIKDWFELFVAQNVALDGLLCPLVYNHFDAEISRHDGSAFAMLTEFMSDWFVESSRWVDSVIKTTAAESDVNQQKLADWTTQWRDRATQGVNPIAQGMLGDASASVSNELLNEFNARMTKLGLKI